MNNKLVFKSGDVELAVLRPTPKHTEEAQLCANRTFSRALASGALFRQSLTKYMREQKLWDDEKQRHYDTLLKSVQEGELKLKKGGIKLKEAKEVALQVRLSRILIRDLVSHRNELDLTTAEGQSENARFNYLVSVCTVYNHDGKPFFKSYDEYLNRMDEQAAVDAATKLASMLYGLDSDFEYHLVENQFLKKYNFVDDKLRLIDEKGHLIDALGRLVNEDGVLVNDKDEPIDIDGNLLDSEGNLKIETSPFLDDEGKPVEQ